MNTREVPRTGGTAQTLNKKETLESGIESTHGRSIFSTPPGSGVRDGRCALPGDTVPMAVPVSSRRTGTVERIPENAEASILPKKPTFAQRWPRLCKVLRVAVTVMAFPFLLAVNTVAVPLVYFAVLCSKGLGDGDLAESLGKNGLVRQLWGEDFARRLATDDIPVLLMAASFVFPGLLPLQSLWFSAQRTMELGEGRVTGFAERERDIPVGSRLDAWAVDQGIFAPRYRYSAKAWRPVV